MRPAPTWFGVRRHIIDGPFGGCWTLNQVGALGNSGVMLTDRGLRCLGFWFSIGICGIYLVFTLEAAIEEFFFYHDFYR